MQEQTAFFFYLLSDDPPSLLVFHHATSVTPHHHLQLARQTHNTAPATQRPLHRVPPQKPRSRIVADPSPPRKDNSAANPVERIARAVRTAPGNRKPADLRCFLRLALNRHDVIGVVRRVIGRADVAAENRHIEKFVSLRSRVLASVESAVQFRVERNNEAHRAIRSVGRHVRARGDPDFVSPRRIVRVSREVQGSLKRGPTGNGRPKRVVPTFTGVETRR